MFYFTIIMFASLAAFMGIIWLDYIDLFYNVPKVIIRLLTVVALPVLTVVILFIVSSEAFMRVAMGHTIWSSIKTWWDDILGVPAELWKALHE